jgi:hypothetical protein
MSNETNSIHSCRRKQPREAVALAASAMSVTRSRSVMINDVSNTGARLNGRDLPPPGDDILMIVGSQDRMGTVIWRTVEHCGVQLDESLDASALDLMKQEAAWDTVMGVSG